LIEYRSQLWDAINQLFGVKLCVKISKPCPGTAWFPPPASIKQLMQASYQLLFVNKAAGGASVACHLPKALLEFPSYNLSFLYLK
jgi:hypothetical protein